MIQTETNLVVADNSGARSVRVFRIYGGSHRKSCSVGDIVLCAVKDAIPNGKIKKSQVVKAVIVRTSYPIQRKDGSSIRFKFALRIKFSSALNSFRTKSFIGFSSTLNSK